MIPVISTKQTGYEGVLAGLVADACLSCMPPPGKAASVVVDNVRVAKLIGGAITDSQMVRGVVVQRDTDGAVKHVEKAKIAVFGCSIEASSAETKGVVVIKNAEELMAYNKGEERMMEESIKGVADSGARVVVSGGSISEIALHFIEKYGMMAVRVPSKFELRRLCRATGAACLVRVGPPMPAELGYADSVSVQELSSRLVTVFRQDSGEDSAISTIVLRGPTMNMLDDMERAIDDAVHTARVLCKDGRFVPGGGAAEMELAHRLHAFADSQKGLETYCIHKFGEALEVVARTLAENSGQPVGDAVAALYTAHAAGKAAAGVDVDVGGVKDDMEAAGVVDSLVVKLSALRFAAETAITVLRVDQIIMSKQVRTLQPLPPLPPPPRLAYAPPPTLHTLHRRAAPSQRPRARAATTTRLARCSLPVPLMRPLFLPPRAKKWKNKNALNSLTFSGGGRVRGTAEAR